MLVNDDLVTERQSKPGARAGRSGCEKGIEDLWQNVSWDPIAVIPDTGAKW